MEKTVFQKNTLQKEQSICQEQRFHPETPV